MKTSERISELEREIAGLESRLPKHSIPPAMLLELEELEEELASLRTELSSGGTQASGL